MLCISKDRYLTLFPLTYVMYLSYTYPGTLWMQKRVREQKQNLFGTSRNFVEKRRMKNTEKGKCKSEKKSKFWKRYNLYERLTSWCVCNVHNIQGKVTHPFQWSFRIITSWTEVSVDTFNTYFREHVKNFFFLSSLFGAVKYSMEKTKILLNIPDLNYLHTYPSCAFYSVIEFGYSKRQSRFHCGSLV